jgi:hypothetical protein
VAREEAVNQDEPAFGHGDVDDVVHSIDDVAGSEKGGADRASEHAQELAQGGGLRRRAAASK